MNTSTWAVKPAAHVEAMLVLGDVPGEQRFRLDVPGKAVYKLGRLAEMVDVQIKVPFTLWGTGCSHAHIKHSHTLFSCVLTIALATLFSGTLTMQTFF